MTPKRSRAHWAIVTILSLGPVLGGFAQVPELPGVTQGDLRMLGPDGQPAGSCPLRHTDVQADIAGYIGRVTVTQIFHNPTDRKIEAVYIFPLPADAAVDDMVMMIGDRRIVGQIKERGEAREIYEQAKAAGHVATLLDQERPNIFTQSVANIEPGVEVRIEISYVETLKYEDGAFTWHFPMVVGPRYIPGDPTSRIPQVSPDNQGKVVELDPRRMTEGPNPPQGTGWSPDTTQVPDASRVTPPVIKPGMRAGHDIALQVDLDAGIELAEIKSELHEIDVRQPAPHRATISLKDQEQIPNRDFILHYRLANEALDHAFLVHTDARGSYFALILQPPPRIVPATLVGRELVFVLDTSGSMSGFPIEKAKQVMARAIDQMRPGDAFNLVTFSGDTRVLWEQPRAATPENVVAAQEFLAGRQGGGGTEMMKAIEAALLQKTPAGPSAVRPIRIVCFMTDGLVGNDMAIIDAVKKHAGTTRVFSFGIGNSVNRFLLDGMARAGRGEVEYVTLQGQADAAAERFHERILAPVLTDVTIDWGALPVADVYPPAIPDVFSAKPIVIHGRLTGTPEGTITVRGNTGLGPYAQAVELGAPPDATDHEALASLWARAKVEDLMARDYAAAQSGQFPDELKQQVTALGLEFRLMTQFTSFVAVEELTVTAGGEPVQVTVPVEMPQGVSYEGVFGAAAGDFLRMGLGYGGGGGGGALSSMGHRKAGAPAFSPPPTGQEQMRRVAGKPDAAGKAVAREDVDEDGVVQDLAQSQPAPDPAAKLAASLADLAAKVAKEGQDGNYALGKLKVTRYRVDVLVYLADLSEPTLAALKELGFEQTGESKSVRLLIGSVDVRKLLDVARLPAVVRVKPVVEPGT